MRESLPPMKFTKDQLLEALEARRPWAKQYDAKMLAKHKKDEAAFFAKFQQAVKEAAKWDYAAAKRHHFSVFTSRYAPQCPQSAVQKLDRVLETYRITRQIRFTITDSSHPGAFWLLTHNEKAKADMC